MTNSLHGTQTIKRHCPKCIIDDGRLAAAARLFADATSSHIARREAFHLAGVADAVARATECAFSAESIDEAQADELHAMSELSCHRAAALRAWARKHTETPVDVAGIIETWADELASHTTAQIGGEYHGAWEVVGTSGIKKKT